MAVVSMRVHSYYDPIPESDSIDYCINLYYLTTLSNLSAYLHPKITFE